MRRCLFLLLLLVAVRVGAQSEPVIRAKLVPASNAIVGEPIRLEVEVLVPNFFTGAPEFPPFEIDGAIVTLSDDRPEHFNEQFNRSTYAGIRRFYLIYAEQPGAFTIPSVLITVPYAANPPETTTAKLLLPQLHFSAAIPPEARDLDYFLPTSRLTMAQQWSGPLDKVRVGDSLSRTIIVTAQKTKAMLIPPLPLVAPDGVRVYARQPGVQDETSQTGAFTRGIRTERATYLFTHAGDYVLPEIEISWWNLSTQRIAKSKLPATQIHVSNDNAYVSEVPPAPEPTAPAQQIRPRWRGFLPVVGWGLAALAVFVGLAWFLLHWWPRLRSYFQSRAVRSRESEAGHWRCLKRALARNDAPQSYALLLAWLRCTGLSLDRFQRRAADPQLDREIKALSQTLFQQESRSNWSGQSLLKCLIRNRQSLVVSASKPHRLPALNPD